MCILPTIWVLTLHSVKALEPPRRPGLEPGPCGHIPHAMCGELIPAQGREGVYLRDGEGEKILRFSNLNKLCPVIA